jgi:hypothetical protein
VIRNDPEEREEALRILYRLRGEWQASEKRPLGALEAVDALIEEYEGGRETEGGSGGAT